MKKIACLAAILAAAFVACSTPRPDDSGEAALRVDRGPYIQATTPHATTVCWRTTGLSHGVVHVTGLGDVGDAAAVTTFEHAVRIENLKEATAYTYRVEGEKTEHTFKTAPGIDAPLSACVIGDSGEGSKEQMQLAKLMEKERFDLFLHTGDIVYPHGGDSDYDKHFFPQYGALIAEHPFWAAVGNHDRHKPENGEPYKRIFKMEINNPEKDPYYYSFTWGCAKFVSIESYGQFKKPGPHMEWLEKELASNDRKWLVLMMHVPIYSTGNHGDAPELITMLVPLIEKYKVNLVLQGHDHMYERGTKNDVTYVVTGGGGAKLYPIKSKHAWTGHTESSFHFVRLDFTKEKIVGKMVRADGSVGDNF